MAKDSANKAPIESKDELVAYLEAGCKPRDQWRIGTEHEKFGFIVGSHAPLPYDGPQSIRAMFKGLERFGWVPVFEGENPIAMEFDGQSISLEPGGQFELSGAPLLSLHETCHEVQTHLDQVKTVASELGIGFLGVGFHPSLRRDQIPVMPKGRYGIMKRYMPTRGNLG
ncbi:MAG TPA: glutamate-cysteine ligase family protein, partial [Sphingomonadales bacterium]